MTAKDFLRTTLLLYFWFAICACGKLKETPSIPKETPTPTVDTEKRKTGPIELKKSQQGFQLEVLGLDNPNEYAVSIQIQNPESDYFISKKTDGDAPPKFVGNYSKEDTKLVDKEIESGKTYEYTFFSNLNSRLEKKQTIKIEIPRDFAVTGTQSFPKLSGYHRLFLLDGARLQSNGETVTLEIDELISRNGSMETFSSGTKAPLNTRGRSGGFIYLKAKKAVGTFTLYNRGEVGGDGSQGANGSPGTKGTRGLDAIIKRTNESNPLCREENNPYPYCYVCIQPPTRGQQGYAGGAAGPGAKGSDGGDSALLRIEVENADSFQIEIKSTPGEGGDGGRGGDGGPGGPGGDSGSSDRFGICGVSPEAAPAGPTAGPGASGAKGSTGLLNPVCLSLNGKESQDCARFK